MITSKLRSPGRWPGRIATQRARVPGQRPGDGSVEYRPFSLLEPCVGGSVRGHRDETLFHPDIGGIIPREQTQSVILRGPSGPPRRGPAILPFGAASGAPQPSNVPAPGGPHHRKTQAPFSPHVRPV